MTTPEWLDLLDWKRRVFDLYREIRLEPDPEAAWRRWRAVRDDLFATHPQSPLSPDARGSFGGLAYFGYDPSARVLAEIRPADPASYALSGSDGTPYGAARVATASFALGGRASAVELYWLEGYGGGLFLSFADQTSGGETYGGGRYLLDTIKGADLGDRDGRLLLDFNFAYHPSCVYDSRWSCPLAPPGNRLPVPVRAGERLGRDP